MTEYSEIRRRTPKLTNMFSALFYQQWYEDRTANETLMLAFGQRDQEYRGRVAKEIELLLNQLHSEQEAEEYLISFDVDVDFNRDFPEGVRSWLRAAPAVLADL
ncbi:hypothetical protein [Curtobacterium sp. MCBA15_008]|uniref:hypothetical protein n=1 Tax=Curtobacterium sp. MCBA15_008 TaxID=1898736 RepID=UPI0008DE31E7|nr:hypothetical protein [Curtobacterium sp. MCBA15_008]OII04054.1 hypothetical protein BIU96_08515 [Curtobacterium sp. MCBA15_008]